ncbi:MAG: glycosyltransferase family 39 protein [Acidobacteriota bacterium]
MILTLLFIAQHLAILALMAATAFALGRRFTTSLPFRSVAEEVAVSVAVGLGSLGLLGLALGLVGWLQPPVVWSVIVGVHVAAWPLWRDAIKRLPPHLADLRWPWWTIPAVLVLLTPSLLLPLYPPVAYDAAMYHLPYADLFAEQGRVVFASDLRYPVFPQLVNLLFTLIFLVANDISAALVQTLAMLSVGLLLYAWVAPMAGRRAGLWAAAIWLGNPLVAWNARAAMVDVALALFVVVGVYGFVRWWRTRHLGWLVVSAAGCGFAAGTKYHGLIFVAMLVAASCLDAMQKRKLTPVLAAVVVVVLVASPWYARNAYHTGNPVFPLFFQVFGESEWSFFLRDQDSVEDLTWLDDAVPGDDEALASKMTGAAVEIPRLIGERMWSLITEESRDLLLLPWRLSFEHQRFQRAPVSPIYLFLLPWLLLLAVRDAQARWLIAISIGYGVICLATAGDPRYLIPVLGVLAVPAALAIDRIHGDLEKAWPRLFRHRLFRHRLVGAWIGLALLTPATAYSTFKLSELGPLPVTAEQRDAHLNRAPCHGAIRDLNRRLGAAYTAYALQCEDQVYHAEGRLLGNQFGPYRFVKVNRRLQDAAALHEALRGFDAQYFVITFCETRFPPEATGIEKYFALEYHERDVCTYRLLE